MQCAACNTTVRDLVALRRHNKTQKHLRNVASSPAEAKPPATKPSATGSSAAGPSMDTAQGGEGKTTVDLTSDGPDIGYIVHLSDIHIHCERRHGEYRKVFARFLAMVDDLKMHIAFVITGDYLDNKNRITSEEVVLAREFILELAYRAPTFVIAGNHDKNLNFAERVDNLSAVISNGNFETRNLWYLKQSGTYLFRNLSFGVSSVFDYADIRPNDNGNGRTQIALFHGGVVGSPEVRQPPNGGSIKPLSAFDGFDLVMLGDIHKHHFLASHIAYAGSMIQANHGEPWEGHGFILWDVVSRTGVHHHIPNDHRFVSLAITNNILTTETDSLPPNLNVRWEVAGSTMDAVAEIQSRMRKSFNIETEKWQHDVVVSDERSIDGPKTAFDLTLEHQADYIRTWVATNRPDMSESDITTLVEMNEKNNTLITDQEGTGVGWVLQEMEFENVFCYQQKQKLCFDQSRGVHGIVARNNAGKSAIFDIILFTLFGRCTRCDTFSFMDLVHVPPGGGSINDEIIAMTSLTIRVVGGDTWQITRRFARSRGSMLMQILRNGAAHYDGSSRDGTSIITKLVGTFEDFMTTTVFAQNSKHNFLLMSGRDQKEFISRMLRLDIYDSLNKICKKDLKKVEADEAILVHIYDSLLARNLPSDLELVRAAMVPVRESLHVARSDVLALDTSGDEVILSLHPNEPTETTANIIATQATLEKKLGSFAVETHRDTTDIMNDLSQMRTSLELARKDLDIATADLTNATTAEVKVRIWGTEARTIVGSDDQQKSLEQLLQQTASKREMEDVSHALVQKKRDEWVRVMQSCGPMNRPARPLEQTRSDIATLEAKIRLMNSEVEAVRSGVCQEGAKLSVEAAELVRMSVAENAPKVDLGVEMYGQNLYMEEKQLSADEAEVRGLREDMEGIELARSKLARHKYDKQCRFCCDNPFVRDAEDYINAEPAVQEKLTKVSERIEQRKRTVRIMLLMASRAGFINQTSFNLAKTEAQVESLRKEAEAAELFEANKAAREAADLAKAELDDVEARVKKAGEMDAMMVRIRKILVGLSEHVHQKKVLLEKQVETRERTARFSELKMKVSELEAELFRARRYAEAHAELDIMRRRLLSVNESLVVRAANDEIRKKNEETRARIEDLTKRRAESRARLAAVERSEAEMILRESDLLAKMEEMEKTRLQLEGMRQKVRLCETMATLTHHNGIPSMLSDKVIQGMEDTVNQILGAYSKMTVQVRSEGRDLCISVMTRSHGLNAKMLCGSEIFLVEIAFRVAFHVMSNVSKPNFMVCDEGWACLDEDARSRLRHLLAAILERVDYILTVSHLDDVKAWMTRAMHIEVNESGDHHIKQ